MLSTRPLAPGDDGPAQYAYARTPVKGLLKTRGTLQENTVYRGQRTVNGKGKTAALRTPQIPASVRKNGFATMKPTLLVTKPLGDKTPFPNRLSQALKTPAPQTAKLAKLSLFDESLAKTPGNLLLPSARRKSMRLPRSASKKFHTPNGQGNHWDVSDGDVQLDVSQEVEEVTSEEPDYDEIEYMPPKVSEQPFEPIFQLPDYTVVGKVLLDLESRGLYDNSAERFYALDIESVIDSTELVKECEANLKRLELPDDDPFCPPPTPPVRASSRSSLRPGSRASSERPTRAGTSRVAVPPTKPTPPVTRSSTRTASNSTQNTTTHTRVTRSSSSRTASQTTQPMMTRRATAREPATAGDKRPIANIGTRAATTRSATQSRATATLARADSSRTPSRAESERSASTIPTQHDDDDLLLFNCDEDAAHTEFLFLV